MNYTTNQIFNDWMAEKIKKDVPFLSNVFSFREAEPSVNGLKEIEDVEEIRYHMDRQIHLFRFKAIL